MVDNDITLEVVNELSKKNYFIPSYQRGYRWEKQQVEELLEDLKDFMTENSEQEYYCLQPFVVREMSDAEKSKFNLSSINGNSQWYEVIDGQQRLTTITLIRHYINEFFSGRKKIEEPTLKYETRSKSTEFLKNIYIGEDDKAICDGIDSNDNTDLFFINNSYQIIHDWFSAHNELELDTDKYRSTFNTRVKVIWYQIEEQNPTDTLSEAIELFTRINMGKIPLSNAELIKALFLRQKNFSANQELRQVEIAKEWDSMEYALQNDDFWYFLNERGSDKPARIEFIFDAMYKEEKDKAIENDEEENFYKKYGNDDYKTFRFFAEKFHKTSRNTVSENWQMVKDCFSAFKEWFDDPLLYHYIGFLISCGEDIVSIYKDYDNTPKDEFISIIKDKIKTLMKDIKCDDNGDSFSIDLTYDSDNDKKKIRRLLLLFNIEYLINHNKGVDHWYVRFPFDLYKKENWDVEHINSFTTNELNNSAAEVDWVKTAVSDLKNIGIEISSDLNNEIQKFIENPSLEEFRKIRPQISALAGEDVNEDISVKNNIGNLTLLNASINRSYGNDLFPTKRRKVIDADKKGKFIPLCTKNVFLKYYDIEGSSKTIWSQRNGDYDKYIHSIRETLKEFLIINNTENNE